MEKHYINKDIYIRDAVFADSEVILSFIKLLAKYEKMEDEVTATLTDIQNRVFRDKKAEVLLAVKEGCGEIGFALYFNNFSTFLGKPGIYVEDVFVLPEFRGAGVGSGFFKFLAIKAVKSDFGRLEWSCLKWNKSALDFYSKIGAKEMSGWTSLRLDKDGIAALSKLEFQGNEDN